MVMTSPANTWTGAAASISVGEFATAGSVALLIAPTVDTVAASLVIAFTQDLRIVRFTGVRALVYVQVIAVSAGFTVNTLPASAVLLPVQARLVA